MRVGLGIGLERKVKPGLVAGVLNKLLRLTELIACLAVLCKTGVIDLTNCLGLP